MNDQFNYNQSTFPQNNYCSLNGTMPLTLCYVLQPPEYFLLVVLVLLLVVQSRQRNNKQQTGLQDVTFPQVTWFRAKHVPLILNGWQTMKNLGKEGMDLFTNCSGRYGPTFQLPFGPLNVIATADPAIIQKLLSSNDTCHLNKSGYLYKRLFVEEMHDGLFVAPASIWLPHRKCLSRGFTYKTLLSCITLINEYGRTLTLDIDNFSERYQTPLENGNLFAEYLSTRLLHFTAGMITGPGSFSDLEISQIQSSIATHKDCLLYVFQHPHLFLRPIWRRHPRKQITDGATKAMRVAMKAMIAKYHLRRQQDFLGKEEEAMGQFRPLLELMMENKWSEKEILDNFATFIFAEHEAMFASIQFALLHLSQNTDCQARCRQEIDAIFTPKQNKISLPSGIPDTTFLTVSDLSQLKYLERCILESLRLCPPVPVFARRLGASLKLDTTTEIKQGKTIVVMPWVLHRNSTLYPNPEQFNPDRFLPEIVRSRPLYAYLPFSAGRRNCLGWKLSLMQLKITLSWILRHFDVTTKDRLEDFTLHYAVRVIPERHFNIKFVRRQQNKN